MVKAKDMEEYNGSSIVDLKPLQAIRKRPGMYIYDTAMAGHFQLLREIIDNGQDEIMANYGDKLLVQLLPDNKVIVRDFGRGLPTDKYHGTKMSTIEKIFTTPHAGGKFGSITDEKGVTHRSYNSSSGTHGVGTSVLLALSTYVKVTVYREGTEYSITMAYDDPMGTSNTKDYKILEEFHKVGRAPKDISGTKVEFQPDPEVFGNIKYTPVQIIEHLRNMAYLLQNATLVFIDDSESSADDITEQTAEGSDGLDWSVVDTDEDSYSGTYENLDPKFRVFHFTNGIQDYVNTVTADKVTTTPLIYTETTDEETGLHVEVAMQWTSGYQKRVISFANNVHTVDGGVHETSFKSALTKALNSYVKGSPQNKSVKKSLDGEDIREGITAIINVRVPEELLQYEGQTKGKLSNTKLKQMIEPVLTDEFINYFNQHAKVAQYLIDKSLEAMEARAKAKQARKEVRSASDRNKNIAYNKLKNATSNKVAEKELLLCEGQSAAGTVKKARNRKTQGVLEIRGKSLNTEDVSRVQIENNQELQTLVYALGTGYDEDFDLSKLKYDKVIIMTDADDDGSHIQILLLTFFYRHMLPLVTSGHVYIAKAPLYLVTSKAKSHSKRYVWTNEDLVKVTANLKQGYSVKRFKGLGEMNASQLWESTMDADTRRLETPIVEDELSADKLFDQLMGSNSAVRRKFLDEFVDFSLTDNQ